MRGSGIVAVGIGVALAGWLAACSGGTEQPPDPVETPSSGAMTWTELYADYFGPNTPGHCGTSAGCHQSSQAGFSCGTTPATCYQGMVSAGLLDPAQPTKSALAQSGLSPLAWFGGNMPRDEPVLDARAKADVAAWVASGAPEN